MRKFEDVMKSILGGNWEDYAPASLTAEDKAAIKRALFAKFEQDKTPFVDLLETLNIIYLYPES